VVDSERRLLIVDTVGASTSTRMLVGDAGAPAWSETAVPGWSASAARFAERGLPSL
jgi:hypothetical protein